jgi:SAM-dependent methyltransferase
LTGVAFYMRWLEQSRRFIGQLRNLRLIVDGEKRLGSFGQPVVSLPLLAASKEETSRAYVFAQSGRNLNFLDVGANDGALTYLLGIAGNLDYSEPIYRANLEKFRDKYSYYGMDLKGAEGTNLLIGDICAPGYVTAHDAFVGFFDVVYSNNVFEHLRHPWQAAANIMQLIKPGGLGITIAPFAQRYHQVPEDYFRYTHVGLRSLFEDSGAIEVLECGYDLSGRRNDWQGSGTVNDIVPEDKFGAWRETWFTVLIFRKRAAG